MGEHSGIISEWLLFALPWPNTNYLFAPVASASGKLT